MSCYVPLPAYRLEDGGVVFHPRARHGGVLGAPLSLPCGQCLGCRLDRAKAWSLRIMHEASLSRDNCFVTLTYDDAHLPPASSLRHLDFQLFMKRLRKRFSGRSVRYYMCGEYGSINFRPHFHACLFNVSFSDQCYFRRSDSAVGSDSAIYTSPSLAALWPLGHSSVCPLTLQTAGYTARYVISKVTGDAAASHYSGRTPEYNRMSLRPGIGYGWWRQFHQSDISPLDAVVDSSGRRSPVPAYYDKLFKRSGADLAEVKAQRELRALPHRADNVPSRLAVKAEVKRAQVRTLLRG